ncbi:hypothetical protein DN752_10990 [Echinicola strongylocentroti]|uniref:Sulfotransferase n=1 Tax=Echinicola strongylocentroti TaxID=1795355 RepID=A0A2Z4II64_9BACT|nr:sulfotransferase [Echinicola strongylocentroti]AWW30605.1 hypothetical protein DN752_10990 [Echinicola strongylocentroti]
MMNKANLFVVGAAKCGTTSLHEYLNHHPEIWMSDVKEPHYFSGVGTLLHDNTSEKARKHTTLIKEEGAYHALFKDGQSHLYRGESSPSYLWDPSAAKKIAEYNPQSKIIILLRDPVKRAFSHFQMGIQAGFQKRMPFYEALQRDYSLPDHEKGWNKSHLYVELGFYYDQVMRYYNVLPTEQIKLIKFEDFVKDIHTGMEDLYKFLKVSPHSFQQLDKEGQHNQAISPKYPIVDILKDNKFTQKLLSMMPQTLKNHMKSYTHKEGYREDLILDEKSVVFLNECYKENLAALENEFAISFQ